MRNLLLRSRRNRRGAAAIEFAVCIPVIMLLVLSSIEATSFIFLKQSLQTASYEGVRAAIEIGGDNATARAKSNNILSARQIRDAEVRFPLGTAESRRRGDLVAVEISAPTSANSPLAGRFLQNRILTVRTVMVKQ